MKRILLLFIALAAVWGAAAKIRLPEIIGNDMVLQQNAEVRLWGWAEPHAAVKVETSWGAGAAVKSDADGRWAVSVRTPAGSYEPQRITFASGDRVTFDRVLIGEVWFAGGQSNMEMPLGGFWQCPVTDANEIIARAGAKSGKLHYVKIPHAAAYTPQDRTAGSWTPCTTATAAKFTAAGYFFAEMLNDVLGDATARVQPPTDKGRRLKIFYMTQASTKPPHFVIFCNDARLFHFSYQRYLENQIRGVFGLAGMPIRMTIRQKGDKEE